MKCKRVFYSVLVPVTTACVVIAGADTASATASHQVASAQTAAISEVELRAVAGSSIDQAALTVDEQSFDQLVAALKSVPAHLQNVDTTVAKNRRAIEKAMTSAPAGKASMAANQHSRSIQGPNWIWCAGALIKHALLLGLSVATLVQLLITARAQFGSVTRMWEAIRDGWAEQVLPRESIAILRELRAIQYVITACAVPPGMDAQLATR